MNFISKNFTFLLVLVSSVAISLLIVVLKEFPFLGISISIVGVSGLIFAHKKYRSVFSQICFVFSLILAFFLVYRAQPFLTLLNILGAVTCIAALAIDHPQTKHRQLMAYIGSAWVLLIGAIRTHNIYKLDAQAIPQESLEKNWHRVKPSIIPLAITVILLVIIVPLLSYANPFFERAISNFVKLVDLNWIIEYLTQTSIIIWVWRVIIFSVLALFLPRFLSVATQGLQVGQLRNTKINLAIPKLAISLILALFFITQLQLFTASTETLLEMGYTHSRLSREVFTQLSLVSLIVFGLIYEDKNKQNKAKLLNYVLLIEGMFLSSIAFKSVFDYSWEHGFTFRRLWGFTVVFWMLGVYLATWFLMWKKKADFWYAQALFVFSLVILMGVNIINFDYLVYHINPPRVNGEVDTVYLLRHISVDANAYHLEIGKYYAAKNEGREGEAYFNQIALPQQHIERPMLRLQAKYANLDWRTFNYAQYRQYQQIKQLTENTSKSDENSTDSIVEPLELTATVSGQVALELLQEHAEIELENYGEAGVFVTSINGVASNAQNYWAFYVNNEYSQTGVSQTILQEGDTIQFIYEALN